MGNVVATTTTTATTRLLTSPAVADDKIHCNGFAFADDASVDNANAAKPVTHTAATIVANDVQTASSASKCVAVAAAAAAVGSLADLSAAAVADAATIRADNENTSASAMAATTADVGVAAVGVDYVDCGNETAVRTAATVASNALQTNERCAIDEALTVSLSSLPNGNVASSDQRSASTIAAESSKPQSASSVTAGNLNVRVDAAVDDNTDDDTSTLSTQQRKLLSSVETFSSTPSTPLTSPPTQQRPPTAGESNPTSPASSPQSLPLSPPKITPRRTTILSCDVSTVNRSDSIDCAKLPVSPSERAVATGAIMSQRTNQNVPAEKSDKGE